MTPPFALDARLRGVTPPAHDTLWRVAMPNIGKAHLGLVCKSQGLTAVEKIAVGENVSFLERELAALQELASYPELSSSVPAILNVDSRPDHLAVFESALPGRSMLSLLRTGLFARRQHERWLTLAAAWIAQFQTVTAMPAREVHAIQSRLREKIRFHPGFTARTRDRLLAVLDAQELPAWQAAAHGDYWGGNLMIARDRIAVADWTEYKPVFHPYHDPGFLLLTYGREFVSGARQRLPQSRWLPAAFGAHSRFRPLAEHFLESYSAAWGRSTGSEVRSYLPLVMAHYACYGQQAQYWTEACEIWSTNPELFFG